MKPDAVRLDAAIYPRFVEITTRFGDMDLNAHLNNVAYARYFEEARVTFNHGILIENGHRLPELREFRIMVASVSIDYLREGKYGPPVRIGIGVSRIGNSSFAIGAACFQEDSCLAVHDSVIAFKGPTGGIPDVIREKLMAQSLKLPR